MLLEFGLGTDGELRQRGMEETPSELQHDGLMVHESRMSAQDDEITRFRGIFDDVKKIRAGHTAVMTLRTLDDKTQNDIVTEYRFRSQIGKRKWRTPFGVVLPNRYAKGLI